eukprot:747854-Hanusia_phi.AAC.8
MYGSSALRTLAIFLALSDALCFTPSLFLKHGQRHLQLARVAARIQNRQHAQLRMEADDQAVEGKPQGTWPSRAGPLNARSSDSELSFDRSRFADRNAGTTRSSQRRWERCRCPSLVSTR